VKDPCEQRTKTTEKNNLTYERTEENGENYKIRSFTLSFFKLTLTGW